MSERLTHEIREEIEKKMTDDAIGVRIKIKSGIDITVPGEEEACELVEYHQKEWARITNFFGENYLCKKVEDRLR